jgi:hypothetical protein
MLERRVRCGHDDAGVLSLDVFVRRCSGSVDPMGGMGNRRLPVHLERHTTGKLTLAHATPALPEVALVA